MATAVATGPDAVATPTVTTHARRRVPARWVVVVWFGFVAGFVVALVALAHPRWFPILDMAQTEMRLRDVFSAHPPLIGLPGRIGTWRHQGSHPGPLSFWALAPFYKLFGSSAWAMQVATACLNALAIGSALLIGRRRGGTTLFLGVGAMVAVLTYFFGPSVLTQAWNPYLPLLWFVVFVLAVWSVLCDDFAMLPVAAIAACFCLQTHISYLGLVGGLGAAAVGWSAWTAVRRREQLGEHFGRWVAITTAVVLVTAIPPVVQELTGTDGNLTLIWRYFTNPPESPIGIRAGAEILLVHLNPWRLIAGQDATTGSVIPGVLLLGAWSVGAVAALRLRVRALVALDVVLLGWLALGLLSIARIFGFVWYYLMLWAWELNACMILATVWAVVEVVRARRPVTTAPRRTVAFVLAAVMAGYLVGFAVDAATVTPPTPRVSATLGRLVRDTIAAIDGGRAPGGGRDGRYQVTIVDTTTINAPGYGLVSELERDGIRAGFPDNAAFRSIVPRRSVSKRDATAVIHYSVGNADIAKWRARPGVVMLGPVDLRTPAERREVDRLAKSVPAQLRAAGRVDLVPDVEGNLFTTSLTPGLPDELRATLLRLQALGRPSAVFIGPPQDAE